MSPVTFTVERAPRSGGPLLITGSRLLALWAAWWFSVMHRGQVRVWENPGPSGSGAIGGRSIALYDFGESFPP